MEAYNLKCVRTAIKDVIQYCEDIYEIPRLVRFFIRRWNCHARPRVKASKRYIKCVISDMIVRGELDLSLLGENC